MNILIY